MFSHLSMQLAHERRVFQETVDTRRMVFVVLKVTDFTVAIELNERTSTMEKTEEKSRLTVDLFSEEQADPGIFRTRLWHSSLMMFLLDYYNNRNYLRYDSRSRMHKKVIRIICVCQPAAERDVRTVTYLSPESWPADWLSTVFWPHLHCSLADFGSRSSRTDAVQDSLT